jgi:hypothetical protein
VTPQPERVGSERLAHLTDAEIEFYISSKSNADELGVIEQHVTACSLCLQRVKEALRGGG